MDYDDWTMMIGKLGEKGGFNIHLVHGSWDEAMICKREKERKDFKLKKKRR